MVQLTSPITRILPSSSLGLRWGRSLVLQQMFHVEWFFSIYIIDAWNQWPNKVTFSTFISEIALYAQKFFIFIDNPKWTKSCVFMLSSMHSAYLNWLPIQLYDRSVYNQGDIVSQPVKKITLVSKSTCFIEFFCFSHSLSLCWYPWFNFTNNKTY